MGSNLVMQLKNILVPVDFSQPSKNALAYGLSLAMQFHARLVVAHVVPSMAAFNTFLPGDAMDLEKLAFASARKSLLDFVPSSMEVQTILRSGDVRSELLGLIDQEKVDLVVIGSHGRKSLERFLLGSTTEHILRKVPVPILTVSRIDSAPPGPVPIHRIVYAADLSSSTENGLRYAANIARAFGARLTVVHAIDPMESGSLGIEVPGAMAFDFAAIQEQAMARLKEAVAAARATDIQTDAFVVEGTPHSTIVRFAEEAKADLLVLNLQSKGMLERVMLGATAERVIRSSHIPVLSIPIGTALR